MKEFTDQAPEQRKTFPDTLELNVGECVFGQVEEVRHDVRTKYGARTVVELTRLVDGKRLSAFWPNKKPVPPLSAVFVLRRLPTLDGIKAHQWSLKIADTSADVKALADSIGWTDYPHKKREDSKGPVVGSPSLTT